MSNTTTRYRYEASDNTRAAVSSVTSGLERINAGVMDNIKRFGAMAGAGVMLAETLRRMARQMYEFVASTAKSGDELAKMGRRVGETADELSFLKYAAESMGGQLGDVERMAENLAKSMGDARDGSKQMTDVFDRLGISTAQLVGPGGELRNFSDMLPLIAEGLKNLGSQADRVEIAKRLRMVDLLPTLQGGVEGVDALRQQMDRYGGTMSSVFGEQSEEFTQSQGNLQNAMDRFAESITEVVMPAMTALNNMMGEAVAKSTSFGAVMSAMPGSLGAAWQGFQPQQAPLPPEQAEWRQSWAAHLEAQGMSRRDALIQAAKDYATMQEQLAADFEAIAKRDREIDEILTRGPAQAPAAPRDWMIDIGGGQAPIIQTPPDETEQMMAAAELRHQEMVDSMIDQWEGYSWQEPAREISGMGRLAATEFAYSMTSAFDRVLWAGQNVAEALGDMFSNAFRGILSGLFRLGVGLGLNFISPGLGTALGFASKRQAGGPVSGGQPYIVGEGGPELFFPSSSGQILPNHAAAGGGVVNISIHAGDNIWTDPLAMRELAHRLGEEIEKVQRGHRMVIA